MQLPHHRPRSDDVMLNFQSLSFHDLLTLRSLLECGPPPNSRRGSTGVGMGAPDGHARLLDAPDRRWPACSIREAPRDDGGSGQTPDTAARADLSEADRWAVLRRATPARIGLGRSGDAVPLRPMLDFQLAHAQARDAVHAALDVESLAAALPPHRCCASTARRGPRHLPAAPRSGPTARRRLHRDAGERGRGPRGGGFDLVFVVADGLSATAIANHAAR